VRPGSHVFLHLPKKWLFPRCLGTRVRSLATSLSGTMQNGYFHLCHLACRRAFTGVRRNRPVSMSITVLTVTIMRIGGLASVVPCSHFNRAVLIINRRRGPIREKAFPLIGFTFPLIGFRDRISTMETDDALELLAGVSPEFEGLRPSISEWTGQATRPRANTY